MRPLGLFDKPQKPWLLIDVSFLAYRALHSVGFLELDDVATGVIFGFLKQFRHLCEELKSNRVVFFFDSSTSFRKDVYPNYKKKRHKDRTEDEVQIASIMWDQVKLLRLLFTSMGVQCLSQKGLESDDLMALAAKQLRSRKEHGIIVTADGDLYQCINRYVHTYNPMKRVRFSTRSFKARYGISPKRWGEVKAIGGCTSDNVAGVEGVGEKTAIKYLIGELPDHYKKHKNIVSEEGKAIRNRNRPLVKLPHKKTKQFELRSPEFDTAGFFEFCEAYGMVSILNKRQAWRTFFHGEGSRARKRKSK